MGLERKRQVPYLVEEDNAFPGRLEYAGLVGVRAGESPLDVAEKLRFNEVLDKAPAVAGDEGLPGERAQRVQCPGYGLLACACLSGNGEAPEYGGSFRR